MQYAKQKTKTTSRYTQSYIANILDTNQSGISRIFNGKTEIKAKHIEKLLSEYHDLSYETVLKYKELKKFFQKKRFEEILNGAV